MFVVDPKCISKIANITQTSDGFEASFSLDDGTEEWYGFDQEGYTPDEPSPEVIEMLLRAGVPFEAQTEEGVIEVSSGRDGINVAVVLGANELRRLKECIAALRTLADGFGVSVSTTRLWPY